ncbi:unnamed protein product [Sphagnum compactum]
MCDEIGNNLASWSSMSQFDDLVWDEFEENTDHMVPEPDDDDDSSEQTTAWVTTTRRMMLQPQQQQVAVVAEQQQSFALVTKSGPIISQHSWGSRGDAVVQHGGECVAMKEEMKDDHTVPGSGDLAAYMMDYSEEVASIGTLPCHHYVLGNMDFDESEFSLFADDSDKVDAVDKSGKNTINWDAVDTLLRTNSSFAEVSRYNSDELQLPGSLSSSDLQSSISMPPQVRSSPDSDGKLEFNNTKMEFISMDSPGHSLPSLPIMQEQGCCGTDNSSKLEPDEQQLQPLNSTSNLNEKDPLKEGKVDNAQKHVRNQKHSEEKCKRYPKRWRVVQGMSHVHFQEPQQLRPMAYELLLPRQHSQPSNSCLGYPPHLQRPIMPYMPAGYAPCMHLLPALPPNLLHAQMQQQQQQQGPCTNCHEPCPTRLADVPLPPHHLLPQRELPVPCPSSSSSMTRQEKLEKLRRRQQMQAQLAVERQQQQLALQGLTAIEAPVLPKMHAEPSEIMPGSHLKQSAISLSVQSSSEMSPEGSFSVGQTNNTQPLLGEEEQTMDADVLLQLQNMITQLADKTRLFIRDSLYRLARSARKRQATGVSGTEASDEDSEYELEPSTSGGQPLVAKMNMVETQTNPIDRSIAHLLFHQRASQQPKSGPHFSPAAGSTLPPRSAGQGTMSGLQICHPEALPSGNLAPDMALQPSTRATFPGADVLQPSSLVSEDLPSGLGRRRLLWSAGNTEEKTSTVTLDHHANSFPSLSTEYQSAAVTQEGPSVARSQEGMDAIVIVPGSKLKVGQEDMESQAKKQLQRAVGLSELGVYIDEIALLEPGAATDGFVSLSCPSHSLSSV